ncbi:MAG TPA: ABC transporter substrate-binding protein [Candidatus Binataceae bacterium]|nr:ABC transporter substrate-binding protein [Candidatus Binataceae bacterium]
MRKLTFGLSLPLTGAYANFGRQVERALQLFVSDTNASGFALEGERCEAALICHDDASRRDRAAEIYRALAANHEADLLLGPYSTALTRAVIPITEEARMLLVNHGGAADDLHDRAKMLVSVLSPASTYMHGFIRLVSSLKMHRKRIAIAAADTPFSRTVAAGAEAACGERRARIHGIRIRLRYTGPFTERTPAMLTGGLRRNRINVMLSAGSYEYDLAMMRFAAEQKLFLPVLGCVAGAMHRFARDLGDASEGLVAPSQWEPAAPIVPELGPPPHEFVRRFRDVGDGSMPDYPAAQAYAAGLLMLAAIRAAGPCDQMRLRTAFNDLRTSTLFGQFAVEPASGRQIGHQMVLVQWHRGYKVLIDPDPPPDRIHHSDFSSGWGVVTGSLRALRLIGPESGSDYRIEHLGNREGEDDERD